MSKSPKTFEQHAKQKHRPDSGNGPFSLRRQVRSVHPAAYGDEPELAEGLALEHDGAWPDEVDGIPSPQLHRLDAPGTEEYDRSRPLTHACFRMRFTYIRSTAFMRV